MKSIKKMLNMAVACALVVTMAFGAASMNVSAASSKLETVYVSGTQDNAYAKKLLKQINKARKKNGLNSLKMDQKYNNLSLKRAAELTIYIPESSPHKRPNGKSRKSICDKFVYEMCFECTSGISAKEVVDSWMSSSVHKKGVLYKKAKSVGIGCFVVNGVYYICVDMTTAKVTNKVTETKNKNVTKKISALKKYVKKSCFGLSADKEISAGKKITVTAYFTGKTKYNAMVGSVPVAAKSFTWSSSDTKIATVSEKGVVTGLKKGKVKITAALKSNPNIKKTITIAVKKADTSTSKKKAITD